MHVTLWASGKCWSRAPHQGPHCCGKMSWDAWRVFCMEQFVVLPITGAAARLLRWKVVCVRMGPGSLSGRNPLNLTGRRALLGRAEPFASIRAHRVKMRRADSSAGRRLGCVSKRRDFTFKHFCSCARLRCALLPVLAMARFAAAILALLVIGATSNAQLLDQQTIQTDQVLDVGKLQPPGCGMNSGDGVWPRGDVSDQYSNTCLQGSKTLPFCAVLDVTCPSMKL